MNQLRITRSVAVVFFLALALLSAGFSFATMAQGASRMQVLSAWADGSDVCGPLEEDSAAVRQGESFAIDVQGLTADEPVFITLLFPDGRVFSPTVAGVEGSGGLDGAFDRPADAGYIIQANSGGDYVGFLQTTNKWPLGCYKVVAQGVTSQIQVSDFVVLQATTPPVAVGGPLALLAQSRASQKPNGEQDVLVDIYGRRFMSGETIELQMVQPDGTIIDLPQDVQADGTIIRPSPPVVSTVGSFQIAITMGTTYQEGDYTFIARSGNGQSVSKTFTLRRQTVTARGFGLLNISNPGGTAPITQEESFQLQGRRFRAGEDVAISLIQANGVRRPLSVVQTNQLGEFVTNLTLGRQLPTGQHQLLAASATTVVTKAIQLNLGSLVVPSTAAAAPIVVPRASVAPSPALSASTTPATPDPIVTMPSTTVTTEPPPSITVEPSTTVTTEPPPSITVEPSTTVTAEPPPSITVEPSTTVEPSPSATAASTSFQGDPCGCSTPNFVVDPGGAAPSGEPSDLIPIAEPSPPPAAEPSF